MSHRMPETSQTRNPLRTTLRTGTQALIGVAAVMPFLFNDLGIEKSSAIAAGVIGFSAAVTRIMAIPAVNALLSAYGLGAEPRNM